MLMNLIHFVISIWVPLVCALIIVAVLPLVAGYIVLMERKVMADMQARLGPMRVGPHGLLQPIADAVKLLIKEDIIPDEADKMIFWFAPLISVTAAMLAMSALAIGPWFQIAELNVGLLFIVGISALGIFGIVLGGWSSNSHYSLLGALRSGDGDCGRAASGRDIVDSGNYRGAERLRRVVRLCRAGRIFCLHSCVHRGDQSRAV
jgi:NADH-quinone oxidoreductase subunit H